MEVDDKECMREDRLKIAKQASRHFYNENRKLPTYQELSTLTGYTVNSLGILSCRYNVELCRLLTKEERGLAVKRGKSK